MSTTETPLKDTKFGQKAAGPVEWLDDRLGLGGMVRKNIRKVFPDHWSFLLGEIALWSFVVLLLTGTFLTFWFQPSMAEVPYEGSYEPMRGLEMSQAYASTLNISFDIRGGLLIRQIHHWAAALFMAAIIAHMLRVFFTGAYRKPRELNWLIGIGLFAIGLIEGFAGYSLPDDLLSGTGLRFVDGLIRSIPIVGSYLEFFVFGGEFPGELIIARLYMAHIFLLPGLLLGLIAAHMVLLVYHKHTQWPGPGRTEKNVVGFPMLPVYAAKAGGFFFVVFGFTTLMAAFIQINPIWTYGPYNPSEVTAGSQPDWYMGWVEGAVRIMPNWEFTIGPQTFSLNVFIPAVLLMGILFTVLAIWPFFESWVTGDKQEHHLLQRPRNAPTRTAFGVAGMTFYGVCWIAGGNDIIALKFNLDIFTITWMARVLVFVGPVIAFIITRRICISLQRKDNDTLLHGYETGIIVRSAEGSYAEAHAPLPVEKAFALTARQRVPELEAPVSEDGNGVRNPAGRKARLRAWARRFFYAHDVDKPTRAEVDAAAHHFHDEVYPPHDFPDDFSGVSETGVPKQH
ncbi:cytochrome bc1 complex cytochrome b subunit [Mumia sp. DW29H23]|uniref:cytochrome bc1 complex cytochrome b subunit n=1 Tax=Mumia sp. DW29H23 TaxID=3421241 RepID=UPI003D69EE48